MTLTTQTPPGPRVLAHEGGREPDPRSPGRARAVAPVAPVAPVALAFVLGLIYAALPLSRYRRFDTPSWDNAIFEQAVRGYAHLGAPVVDVKGPGYLQLGDHFSPILVMLAPFYRLAPHAQTLLVAQAVLLAISVLVIARVAVERLGRSGGLAVGAAYGLSFGLVSAAWVDFHEVAFAVPLLAAAGAAFVRRRWNYVVAWSLPLVLVKEDLGLTVAVIGVVLLARGARRQGIALCMAGVAAWLVTVCILIPAFSATGAYQYADHLGALGAGGSPISLVLHAAGTKLATVLATVGITGFVALRSPWVWVCAPTLAWRFLGTNEAYWGTTWHYSAVLMPVVFVAALDALGRPGRWSRAGRRLDSRTLPAVMLAIAVTASLHLPLAGLLSRATWSDPTRSAAAQVAMAEIPRGVSVESDLGLLTHLAGDRTVYWVGSTGSVVPDYVAREVPVTPGQERAGVLDSLLAGAESEHPGTTWRVVSDEGGFVVLRRT